MTKKKIMETVESEEIRFIKLLFVDGRGYPQNT